MRITGGEMRGRTVRVPRSDVRPTQDRVREALFSSLHDLVVGARFLDLFAGSGAVGLEALSRGAAGVCWIESNSGVFRVLKNNVDRLWGGDDNDEALCIKSDVSRFLRGWRGQAAFDIVFADPPYHKRGQRNSRADEPEVILDMLAANGVVMDGGIAVIEQGADEVLPAVEDWELMRDKRYGGSRLLFFRQTGEKYNEQ